VEGAGNREYGKNDITRGNEDLANVEKYRGLGTNDGGNVSRGSCAKGSKLSFEK